MTARTKASLHLVKSSTPDSAADLVEEGTMRIKEAVKFTGLSRSFLYVMMDRGDLTWVSFGRARLIPRKALVALLASRVRGIPSTG
jgi:excisionase family DNA binding protein